MGEVFRARDTQLHRDVALKVLPAALVEEKGVLALVLEHAEGFYDGAKDGKRMAVVQFARGDAAKAEASHAVLAFDWTEELKRLFEETRR